jgi:hypothetical protein
MKGHVLTEALPVTDYPTVAIFRRGENQTVLQSELRRLLFSELENFLRSEGDLQGLRFGSHKNATEVSTSTPTNNSSDVQTLDCDQYPEKYVVSINLTTHYNDILDVVPNFMSLNPICLKQYVMLSTVKYQEATPIFLDRICLHSTILSIC